MVKLVIKQRAGLNAQKNSFLPHHAPVTPQNQIPVDIQRNVARHRGLPS